MKRSTSWYLSTIPLILILIFISFCAYIFIGALIDKLSFEEDKSLETCACMEKFTKGTELNMQFTFQDSNQTAYMIHEHINEDEEKALKKHLCFKIKYMPDNPKSNRIFFNLPCSNDLLKERVRN